MGSSHKPHQPKNLRLKPMMVPKKPTEQTSCGWMLFALILLVLFFIMLAAGFLVYKHLKPNNTDDDIIRKRSHLRSSKDSSSENSVDFVAPDSNGLKAFKKFGKIMKWTLF